MSLRASELIAGRISESLVITSASLKAASSVLSTRSRYMERFGVIRSLPNALTSQFVSGASILLHLIPSLRAGSIDRRLLSVGPTCNPCMLVAHIGNFWRDETRIEFHFWSLGGLSDASSDTDAAIH